MLWPRDLREPPEGFVLENGPRERLELRAAAADALRAAGYGAASDAPLAESRLRGRRPLLELRTRDGVLLVRRFAHGGLLRLLTGARFLDPSRPFRELRISAEISRRGVRTPEVVAARARRARPFGWSLEIVTRRAADTVDVEAALARARRGALDRRALGRIAHAAGALVRRLHDCGCLHADLTTKNMLVNRAALEGADPALWILDLDRARLRPGLSDVERRSNLRRLYRFVARREARDGRALTRTGFARFLRGYDPAGERWKADWRAVARAHRRTLLWHAIGWRLERLAASPGSPAHEA